MKGKSKKLRHFFWEGKLHKTLRIVPPRNELFAWCYKDAREVLFVYSHIKFHHEPAFTTAQVCQFFKRTKVSVERDILAGAVRRPELSYTLDEKRYPTKYFWTKAQVYEYHDYLLNVHRGRPREDGRTTAWRELPSRNELRAMMEDNVTILVQDDTTGKTYPAFRETMWTGG